MHAKYVAVQLVHLNHVASKLSFAALYSRCQAHTGAAPVNLKRSSFSSIAVAGCTVEDVPMSTYTNWPLGSCAIYGQSCQIVIEDTVARFAHAECQYTRYWHAGAFELVWYISCNKYIVKQLHKLRSYRQFEQHVYRTSPHGSHTRS